MVRNGRSCDNELCKLPFRNVFCIGVQVMIGHKQCLSVSMLNRAL